MRSAESRRRFGGLVSLGCVGQYLGSLLQRGIEPRLLPSGTRLNGLHRRFRKVER